MFNCDNFSNLNIGLNFFGVIGGLASIVSFIFAIVSFKDVKKFEYEIKIEESSRYYYEKRIELYEKVKKMFYEYVDSICTKEYKKSIDKLNEGFASIVTGLMTLFNDEFIVKFQNLYNISIRNLQKMIANERKMKSMEKTMDDINKILANKPIGYSVTIPVPEKLDEIEWDIDEEIYKFESEIIKYINCKSKAINK